MKVATTELDMRPRRSFSVNPAVEILQRGALNNYMGKIAQKNRNFLDRVGKRGQHTKLFFLYYCFWVMKYARLNV